MARYIVDIPDDVVMKYDDGIEVMDEIAEALSDHFECKKVVVRETF